MSKSKIDKINSQEEKLQDTLVNKNNEIQKNQNRCLKKWQVTQKRMPIIMANVIIWTAIISKFLFPNVDFEMIFNIAVVVVAIPLAFYESESNHCWTLAISAMGLLGIFLGSPKLIAQLSALCASIF